MEIQANIQKKYNKKMFFLIEPALIGRKLIMRYFLLFIFTLLAMVDVFRKNRQGRQSLTMSKISCK